MPAKLSARQLVAAKQNKQLSPKSQAVLAAFPQTRPADEPPTLAHLETEADGTMNIPPNLASAPNPTPQKRPNKPSSPARAEASRRNGARSKGPCTPEGKARSSRNATKHGLRSQTPPLAQTELETYLAALASFTATFHPSNPFETRLVQRLAQIDSRLQRAHQLDSALFHRAHDQALDWASQFPHH